MKLPAALLGLLVAAPLVTGCADEEQAPDDATTAQQASTPEGAKPAPKQPEAQPSPQQPTPEAAPPPEDECPPCGRG